MSDNTCIIMVTIIWRKVLVFLALVAALFVYNEFLMYYVVLLQCSWPQLDSSKADSNVVDSGAQPVRAMFIADTHLLGSREGHWFDRLRREWMMERSFQSAVSIFNPEIVFVLGDLLDEGKWASDTEFHDTVLRFQKIFSVGPENKFKVVVGNHDIGFHYMINAHNQRRFLNAFDSPSVRRVDIRGNTFLLLNSMAFEGDGCSMCHEASRILKDITTALDCHKGKRRDEACRTVSPTSTEYTRPIMLQHFPLYRPSDANCSGVGAAEGHEKTKKFEQRMDCLAEAISKELLESLNPRLVISAHTHYYCRHVHYDGTEEYSVASFSWRNQQHPSFLLAEISNNNVAINTCFQPKESTVVYVYIIGGLAILLWFVYSHRKCCRGYRTMKLN